MPIIIEYTVDTCLPQIGPRRRALIDPFLKRIPKTNIKKYLSATLVIKLVKHMQLFLKKSVLYKISFEMKKYF